MALYVSFTGHGTLDVDKTTNSRLKLPETPENPSKTNNTPNSPYNGVFRTNSVLSAVCDTLFRHGWLEAVMQYLAYGASVHSTCPTVHSCWVALYDSIMEGIDRHVLSTWCVRLSAYDVVVLRLPMTACSGTYIVLHE